MTPSQFSNAFKGIKDPKRIINQINMLVSLSAQISKPELKNNPPISLLKRYKSYSTPHLPKEKLLYSILYLQLINLLKINTIDQGLIC